MVVRELLLENNMRIDHSVSTVVTGGASRLGKPEEFGSLVMELNRNSYFNGQCLRLDGAIRMAPR